MAMMAFSLPCWKTFRALFNALLIALTSLASTAVYAEGLTVKNAELIANEEWYFLRADFDVALSKPVEEALDKGISLNFLVELEVTRPRWYWANESIAVVRQNLRISYHALTRQYHFSSNSGNQSFNTLTEAKDELKRIAEWKVFDRNQLKKGTAYQAAVRVKLDVKQLPKPLQVEALGTKEWDLASEWFRFTLMP